jgi:hypothetical protein
VWAKKAVLSVPSNAESSLCPNSQRPKAQRQIIQVLGQDQRPLEFGFCLLVWWSSTRTCQPSRRSSDAILPFLTQAGSRIVSAHGQPGQLDFVLFIPGRSGGFLLFIVFGTTRTFRDYTWNLLVPRKFWDCGQARKAARLAPPAAPERPSHLRTESNRDYLRDYSDPEPSQYTPIIQGYEDYEMADQPGLGERAAP